MKTLEDYIRFELDVYPQLDVNGVLQTAHYIRLELDV